MSFASFGVKSRVGHRELLTKCRIYLFFIISISPHSNFEWKTKKGFLHVGEKLARLLWTVSFQFGSDPTSARRPNAHCGSLDDIINQSVTQAKTCSIRLQEGGLECYTLFSTTQNSVCPSKCQSSPKRGARRRMPASTRSKGKEK